MSLAAPCTPMKLAFVSPHLQVSSPSRQHPYFSPGSSTSFITVRLSSFQHVSEWLRSIRLLKLLQLYIYIIRISPTTAFFFHPFLSSNSPLGSERYDLWEDPRLKLPVQELWLSYLPVTINIKPPKLVYRTLWHALSCIVSSLRHWYRTFRPHRTVAPRGLYIPL